MNDSLAKDDIANLIGSWESSVNPLAPLTKLQKDVYLDLSQEIKDIQFLPNIKNENQKETDDRIKTVNNVREFMTWYTKKENDWYKLEDIPYQNYLKHLSEQRDECSKLLSQVEACLEHLKNLGQEYELVSNKTNALHQVSEELISDQMKLMEVGTAIKDRLNHFKSFDRILQSLDSSTINIQSPNLESTLDQLNDHIQYLKSHLNYLESYNYLSRYEQCLRRLLVLMRDSVTSGFALAAQHASANTASHYAKFQVAKTNLRPVIALMEDRLSYSELYEMMLIECHEAYVNERHALIGPSVSRTIDELLESNTSKGHVVDLCSLMRSACAFLIHVSLDEYRLYQQFFSKQTDIFTGYLEGLCVCLYDKTRPLVIHMKHLESLAELCSILRLEMLQEQVSTNEAALKAFGNVAEQLLQDVQERLVFRAHMYLRTDVAEYKPSPGDLAYPEKLHMMQSIAQSLHEQEMYTLTRSESRSSLASGGSSTSQEVARINSALAPTGSPADLHGMWYPPVRRTLLCLSRLYRCVERPTFQGISQEALSLCMQSVKDASNQISVNKSYLDGEMFQIKHLLILREQIAPFQVDFTVKEMALDFSKTRTAAAQLLNKRTRLFSLSSNNSLLEFLLEGSPEVREQWLDSRKDVDRGLKISCESFILHATNHLMPDFIPVLEKAENWKNKEILKSTVWASPQALSALVLNAIKNIKSRLPGLQSTMQLYLANRDTEFILYRPIRNNVVGNFTRLLHILVTNGYTSEEQAQIGCPTSEQAYILISSASLIGQQQRKISTSDFQRTQVQPKVEKTLENTVELAEPNKDQIPTEETTVQEQNVKSTVEHV